MNRRNRAWKRRIWLLLIPLLSTLWACTEGPTAIPFESPTATPSPEFTPTIPASPTPPPTSTIQPTPSRVPAPSPSELSLYLSDLPPYVNPSNIEGELKRDRVYWQAEIWINGIHYRKGLGMHAPSRGVGRVSYRVPHGYTAFIALIGLAQQDANPSCSEDGDARFRVYLNNQIAFESGVIRFGETESIYIPVQEKDVIALEVDNADGSYECDHSTWAEARFEP